MKNRILLIEDDPGVVVTVSDLLGAEGYRVEFSLDGLLGLRRTESGEFDLIVLDAVLPGKSGFDICRELRQRGFDGGILMLTGRTDLADRVSALKLGVDDYVTKPFEPTELVARVQALLRRVKREKRIQVTAYRIGDVEIDFDRAEAFKRGQRINLTAKELELLRYLVNNRDRVVSREEILRNVWQYTNDVSSRTVDVHVAWLRQKLERNTHQPQFIQTVRTKGYRFSAE
ncbi:MAG TPA: response regulator transcription factor [Candidatus Sulfopaludibacter sp.]|jgi:two-component system alkaline phosphatase synthesis response regulator PhoP|nr:response regulator transcription factor [Candidatus Sulfopaludibacter sp.]